MVTQTAGHGNARLGTPHEEDRSRPAFCRLPAQPSARYTDRRRHCPRPFNDLMAYAAGRMDATSRSREIPVLAGRQKIFLMAIRSQEVHMTSRA